MEEIIILSQSEILEAGPLSLKAALIAGMIIFLFAEILLFIGTRDLNDLILGCVPFIVVSVIGGLITGSLLSPLVPSGRTEYKALIEENVPIEYVYDNYEVIGRDGEIWILEDKKE